MISNVAKKKKRSSKGAGICRVTDILNILDRVGLMETMTLSRGSVSILERRVYQAERTTEQKLECRSEPSLF